MAEHNKHRPAHGHVLFFFFPFYFSLFLLSHFLYNARPPRQPKIFPFLPFSSQKFSSSSSFYSLPYKYIY
ncbi:unnamed protein product [Meloidogyne enterolobii]|uniref:Uncharacterized protein n=1 Tax=Meloidogyne enterolobii TaxID=390850 RepID=A0ACB0YN04_MELEN